MTEKRDMAQEPSRGVFWVVDGKLLAFPFVEGSQYGLAKSGMTYNHKLLWEHAKPSKCKKPYHYYPRGRVEFDGKGRPVIYLNPNISEDFISDISRVFGLTERPVIRYDGSNHYKCHLDSGYKI